MTISTTVGSRTGCLARLAGQAPPHVDRRQMGGSQIRQSISRSQDPATEMQLATVAEGDAADIDAAVRAARKALDKDPGAACRRRRAAGMIHKIGDLILQNLDELAQLESLDNGKPFAVARVADVPLSADMFHYMSGWAPRSKASTSRSRAWSRPDNIFPSPGSSRSAWSARSFRGISRC